MSGLVHVLPLGIDIEVGEGESLLAAAQRQGYLWPTVCGGDGECGTCFCVVEEGAEHLSPMGAAERDTLPSGIKAGEPRARLACQIRASGRATVVRRGVRPLAK